MRMGIFKMKLLHYGMHPSKDPRVGNITGVEILRV